MLTAFPHACVTTPICTYLGDRHEVSIAIRIVYETILMQLVETGRLYNCVGAEQSNIKLVRCVQKIRWNADCMRIAKFRVRVQSNE